MSRKALLLTGILIALASCQQQQPAAPIAQPPPAAASVTKPANPTKKPAEAKPPRASKADIERAVADFARQAKPASTLADLAEQAQRTEFDLPQLDADRIAAAGIRKLAGRHIDIYTDMPPMTGVDELPAVFDAAVPVWCDYFGLDSAKLAGWKLIASVMKDRDRFARAGLYLESLPDFSNGYNIGSQIWLYDQPSDYYRRHLLLHEGTHAFMLRWLGGAGPPWYMEGMAELVATHRWEDGTLKLAVMPRSKEQVPYWGRVKIVKDEHKAGRGLSLLEIMRYDAHAHLKVEPYGWCWAAAAFLDAHPLTHTAFRDLQNDVKDRTLEFSKRFYEHLRGDWPTIIEDWQVFVAGCDYGYDFARAAVIHKQAAALPVAGATATVQANRGWQSTGLLVEAGKTYSIKASGQYQLVGGEKPWLCEAGGVTLRYAGGQPLGMLLGAVSQPTEPGQPTTLVDPRPIGLSAQLAPQSSGVLYLKINEPSGDLSDNTGSLAVEIREKN